MTTRYRLTGTESDLGGGADFNKELSPAIGTASTLLVAIAASATETSHGFTAKLIPGERGSAGVQDYTVKVKVIVGSSIDLKTRLRRISADGAVLASSAETAAQSLGGAGVKTFELPAVDLGTFAANDRIRVDYTFTETLAAAAQVEIEMDSAGTSLVVPWDEGLLSGAMRDALESAYVAGTWLVEMDLPSPDVGGAVTTVRGSLAGVAAPGVAGYPARVLSIGRIPLGVSLRSSGLESAEISVEWEDTGFELAKIFEGPNGDDAVDSPARIKFAVKGLSEADWHARFTGVLRRRKHDTRRLVWNLSFGPDDRKLTRGEVPRVRLAEVDFPDADDDVFDTPAPLLYGVWNSVGVSNKGAVPTIYIDTINFRYLIAHGFINEITRVYKDGVLLLASAWSRVDLTVNGRDYTLIDFTTNQGIATITADVKGYAEAGVVLERPSQILRHWLANFVVGDYQGGAFDETTPALADGQSFSDLLTLYEDDLDFVGAGRIAEAKKATEHLSGFLTTWNYRGYFAPNGKLTIKPIDHRGTAVYLDAPWVRGLEDEAGELEPVFEDQDFLDRVIVNYLQDAVAGGTAKTLEVRDPSRETNVSEAFSMEWGAAGTGVV